MRRGTASKLNLLVFLIALAVIVSRAQFRWAAQEFSGLCVGISDGDTITVMHNEARKKVRLWGIDCPEKGRPYSRIATRFTTKLAYGKIVKVEVRYKDRYGRIIGWVTLPNGKVLNIELVKAGLARWNRKYAPRHALLEALERDARTSKIGMWKYQ